ncbi:ABC transporter permease [Sinomonas sp. ASV486]|uniref:ABC transporter permease n=1 Tax=Sinomonas sp. ASV486 TaxID=3051170 RepID=UPI0027DACB25|nr:ABC transporter permease [Sinomonas sp. ASV486]MDQ4489899.1 ABC transporter permease [Sinomonas sp. ASV486]
MSPTARRGGGLAAALWAQSWTEVVKVLRTPEYLVGVVVLPAILFAMFGLAQSSQRLPSGTGVGVILFGSFSCYGVVSQALFSMGGDIAQERAKGWLRRLFATPMPMIAYFVGKLVLNIVFSVGIVLLISAVALFGGIRFELGPWAAASAIAVTGSVAFATTGTAIAYWVRTRAATTIVNLVFLPLSFLSGYFMPLSVLPKVFSDVAPWIPTHHLGLLVWTSLAPKDELHFLGVSADFSPLRSWSIVVGWFVLMTVVTGLGYRRAARREQP